MQTVTGIQVSSSAPWDARRIILVVISGGALGTSLWAFVRVGLSPRTLVDGWPAAVDLLSRMWPPYIPSEDVGALSRSVLDTLLMAVAGTVIGVALALPLALMAAPNITRSRALRAFARLVILFTRAVPALVFALVFVRVYSIGVLPGVLALGVHSVGMLGKLFAEAAEGIDDEQRDGIALTGATTSQVLVAGTIRQMIPAIISLSFFRLEMNFRAATLLGFVGAGGVGLYLRVYQGNLRYQELLGATLLVIVLIVAMGLAAAFARRAILGEMRVGDGSSRTEGRTRAPTPTQVKPSPPTHQPWTGPRIRIWLASAATVLLVGVSFTVPDLSLIELVGSVPELIEVSWKLVPKDLSWLTSGVVSDLVETVAIGVAATAIAVVLALPTAVLAASNVSPARWIANVTQLAMSVLRAVPELVIAVIFVAALGLGPATGTLALAVVMYGLATKLFADSIELARRGPREGVVSTGATRTQEVTSAVLPDVFPALLGDALYVLDVSLRSSTVLGIVGAGGIGFLLNNASRTLQFEVVGGIILAIFVIVTAIELLANWVRRQVS